MTTGTLIKPKFLCKILCRSKVRQVRRVPKELPKTASKDLPKSVPKDTPKSAPKTTVAKWFWLMKNNPVTWQEYDSEVASVIEEGFVNKNKTIKIDEERFIDFENMLQRRFDNNSRNRYIKRVGPIPVQISQNVIWELSFLFRERRN